jgi:hypothetical protein
MRSAKKTVLLLALAAALACSVLVLPVATSGAPTGKASVSAPPRFFGIAPQTLLTETDTAYMRAARIGSIRVPAQWSLIQPTPADTYDWSGLDQAVEITARSGITVFPFLYSTPHWLGKATTMPVDSGRQKRAWTAFVRAAIERYGPRGEFWIEHAPGTKDPLPKLPIRTWQIWNEANFFYFSFPVSPSRYARLLKLTQPVIKSADPGAEVILSGLFGDPDEQGRRGMNASDFLEALYRVPGIEAKFDSAALHPYAFHVDDLEELTEEMRAVILDNQDRSARLYITELGWGSQNDPNIVAFEQGIQGQARELRAAYRYLIENRGRLNLKGTYWFSWKDAPGSCNFCDSVGLFRAGQRFKPKPAWHAFVGLTGGRARP